MITARKKRRRKTGICLETDEIRDRAGFDCVGKTDRNDDLGIR